jgi:hypothetical protein
MLQNGGMSSREVPYLPLENHLDQRMRNVGNPRRFASLKPTRHQPKQLIRHQD